jgi:hypothetical protein
MNILSCRPIPEKYRLDVMNRGCPASTVPPAPDRSRTTARTRHQVIRAQPSEGAKSCRPIY